MDADNSSGPDTTGVDSADALPTKEHDERDRRQRIALAAYFRAEARGFAAGHEVEDWLEAEREVGAASVVSVTNGEAQARAMDQEQPDAAESAPAKTAARRPRKAAKAEGAVRPVKAAASTKSAAAKRTTTRKTKPGMEGELGGAA